MTDASSDQEHLNMIIFNDPTIPDRTEYILDETKPSPLPMIIDIAKNLEILGADYLCMPCTTAHYFFDEFEKEFSKPIINMVYETAKYLKERKIKKVGIMATDGTITAGFFQKELESQGIEIVLPSKQSQENVMHLIYKNVKANLPAQMDKFKNVRDELKENGAEVIILGCTELSLIKRDNEIGHGFIDVMDVLAMKAIDYGQEKLKKEYENLIV